MVAPVEIEVNTFSAAVDTVIARSGRPDRVLDIISYVRTTMRECQTLNKQKFEKDITEDQITSVNADPFTWVAPAVFRKLLAVSYPERTDAQSNVIYPHYVIIGKAILQYDNYFYRSGNSWIFAGAGGDAAASTLINVAYISYFGLLQYFKDITFRPARYLINVDGSEGWVYHDDYDDTETLQESAEVLVSNWLLLDWFDLVLEGALAKLYKTGDDTRSVATFALYKQLQVNLLDAEALAAEVQL